MFEGPGKMLCAFLLAQSREQSSCTDRVHKLCTQPLPRRATYHADYMNWRLTCPTPMVTAHAIANNSIVPRSTIRSEPIPAHFAREGRRASEWSYQPDVLARALSTSGGPCIVYSFGVQHADEFTDFYAAQGCQVFAFDPTVNHSTSWKPNVTFYPWGLRSRDSRESMEASSLGQYGRVFGELLSLPEIMARMGHQRGQRITALKLDCEGCEFKTFEDLYCLGEQGPKILSISMELHFWVAHRMEQTMDLERIRYAAFYLQQHNFRTASFRIHHGAIIPYRGEMAVVHPDLEMAGLPRSVCCYMYDWVREDMHV